MRHILIVAGKLPLIYLPWAMDTGLGMHYPDDGGWSSCGPQALFKHFLERVLENFE